MNQKVETRRTPWGASIVTSDGEKPTFKNAGLDWAVKLLPVYHETPTGTFEETNGRYHVTRMDNGTPLGIVGKRYSPVQNSELAEFTEQLIDTDEMESIGFGYTGIGERVYSVTKFKNAWKVLDNDEDENVECYLFIVNTHDGSTAFRATIFPMRLACTNGLRVTMKDEVRTWSIRHSGPVAEKLWQAQYSLGLLNKYFNQFEKDVVERLMHVPMSDNGMSKVLETLFPIDDEDSQRSQTHQKQKREGIYSIYKSADNLNNIRHTGWGALNAVAEWEQWDKTLRTAYRTNREIYHAEQVSADRGTGLIDHAYKILVD